MDASFTNRLLSELGYFTNKKGIILLPPTDGDAIRTAEKKLDCMFSPQMASFLTHYNGGRIFEITIKGVQSLGIKKIPKGLDILESNQILRTFDGWNPNWLEIGEDGFGNYYVVDVNRKLRNGEYPVVFVDHEAIGEKDALMEYAAGYFDFILKATGEMKRIYTPEGDLNDLKTDC